jgi:hypothetical protein
MVLDPFAALGLAGNIVQFVDFLVKLLSESRVLYQSTAGASDENVVFQKIAQHLQSLASNLTTSSVTPRQVPRELKDIAGSCQDVASELLQALERLKVTGSHRRWKSFVQALKSMHIAQLTARLDRLQSQLNTRLLAMMRYV